MRMYTTRSTLLSVLMLPQCQCGQGGNPIRYDNCCNCHYPRCAYCPVRKVRA
ncbi:hypothetical protein CGMCC3_g12295 [Colletotrichum fructicola]|nr:uncharacterized protein CGMCC3_g12295 [Colletotrichum fructicola]KAE9571761.1 hypothetical protein CGMCC3_g12295 [Colletotrichum fructicola]